MTTTLCALCINTGNYCYECINWYGVPEVTTENNEEKYGCDEYDDEVYEHNDEVYEYDECDNTAYENDEYDEYKIMTSYDNWNYEPYEICNGLDEAESAAKDAVSNGVFNYARILNSTHIVNVMVREKNYEYKVLTSNYDYDYELYTSCKTIEEAICVAKDAVSNGHFDYACIKNSSGFINFMMRENILDRQQEARDNYEEYLVNLAEEFV